MWITTTCGKFLKRWEYKPPYLPSEKSVWRSRNNRIRHETTGWFQTGKGVCQGCILSPCLFSLYAECIIWNAGLDEAQAGIQVARRNINNLSYAVDITLMAESKEKLKSLLMKLKEENVKFGLNSHFKKLRSWYLVPSLCWGICNFLSSVSSQQKFEATDRSVLQPSDRPVLHLSVIAQFYLESKGKYILEAWGHAHPKDLKRREAPGPIVACLFMFFSSP